MRALSDDEVRELLLDLTRAAGLCRVWATARASIPSLADEWRQRAERMEGWRERLGDVDRATT